MDEEIQEEKYSVPTTPGDDHITYKHWKAVDPACTVLAAVYNVCVKYERLPGMWEKSVMILRHKKVDPDDLTNWCRSLYCEVYTNCSQACLKKIVNLDRT